MSKHMFWVVGGLLLVLQGGAWAMGGPEGDGPGGMHRNIMEEADTNHDGKVSFDEFKAAHEKRLEERFKKLDANGDGSVDKDELRKGRDTMREKMQDRMEKRQEKSGAPK